VKTNIQDLLFFLKLKHPKTIVPLILTIKKTYKGCLIMIRILSRPTHRKVPHSTYAEPLVG